MSFELKITGKRRVPENLSKEVSAALALVPGQIVAAGLAPYKASVSGAFTSRSGKLLQSFKEKFKPGSGSIQSRSKYVNALDMGATINAKGGGFLTIFTAKGGLKFVKTRGDLRRSAAGPQSRASARSGKWRGGFALVKSVIILPRNFIAPANRQLDQLAEKMLGDALEKGDGT